MEISQGLLGNLGVGPDHPPRCVLASTGLESTVGVERCGASGKGFGGLGQWGWGEAIESVEVGLEASWEGFGRLGRALATRACRRRRASRDCQLLGGAPRGLALRLKTRPTLVHHGLGFVCHLLLPFIFCFLCRGTCTMPSCIDCTTP